MTVDLLALALFVAVSWFLAHRWRTPRVIPLGSIPRAHLGKYRGDDTTLPLRVLLLGALLLGAASCATPANQPQLSPAGIAAYNSHRVIDALDILRNAAKDAEAQTPPLISTATALKVVNFHEAAVRTVHATPSGWKDTVLAALDQLKADVLPAEWARFLPYVNLVKALIG